MDSGVERLVEDVVFVLSAAVISPDDEMAVLSVWVEVGASQQLHNGTTDLCGFPVCHCFVPDGTYHRL